MERERNLFPLEKDRIKQEYSEQFKTKEKDLTDKATEAIKVPQAAPANPMAGAPNLPKINT